MRGERNYYRRKQKQKTEIETCTNKSDRSKQNEYKRGREEERGRERGTSHQAVMLSPKLRRLFTIEENVMHYFSNFIHHRSEREREREFLRECERGREKPIEDEIFRLQLN